MTKHEINVDAKREVRYFEKKCEAETDRELHEFALSTEDREDADTKVGAIIDSLWERTEELWGSEYSDDLCEDGLAEKDKYIAQKICKVQVELFFCLCQISQGILPSNLRRTEAPLIAFPFERL